MSEQDYRRITYDFTVEAGRALLAENPEMRMCFISGAGTDHTSRTMWARVKGRPGQAGAGRQRHQRGAGARCRGQSSPELNWYTTSMRTGFPLGVRGK